MRIARIFLVLFLLNSVIITHELGHFAVARFLGLPVARVSLGFGPAIASWKAGDVEVRISAVLLGGYVELAEEGGKMLASRPPWQSVALSGAGIFVNWILPILVLLIFSRRYRALGKDRRDFPETILRRDLRPGKWIRIPFIGMFIFMLKALASPVGDGVAEEVAWKFSDLSRLIGYFNLIPILGFDGTHVLIGVMRVLGMPMTLLLYFLAAFLWLLVLFSIPNKFPNYYRRLL